MSNGELGVDYSEFVVKSVEIIAAQASMLTEEGPFTELPTMFARVHYQGGHIGEMLFDPVGVTILLDAAMTYLEELEPEDRERFDQYLTLMGDKVTVTETTEEE